MALLWFNDEGINHRRRGCRCGRASLDRNLGARSSDYAATMYDVELGLLVYDVDEQVLIEDDEVCFTARSFARTSS